MKKFSELSNVISDTTTLNDAAKKFHNQTVEEYNESYELQKQQIADVIEPPVNIIPEYMLTDSNYVGFPDLQTQYDIYRSAAFSLFTADTKTVLDVGCGRGDFGDFILNEIKSDVKYTGIEQNQLMIDVGIKKYQSLVNSGNIEFKHSRFDLSYPVTEKYDLVFHNTNMTIDYGVYPNLLDGNNRYEYLSQMIQKSIEVSNVASVFMLLNDNSLTDTYVHYSYGGISKILYDLNVRFAIDNTDFSSIIKLIVFNNTF